MVHRRAVTARTCPGMDLEIIRNHLNATVQRTRDPVIVTTGTLSLTPFNLKAQCLRQSFTGEKKSNQIKKRILLKCSAAASPRRSLKPVCSDPAALRRAGRTPPVLRCRWNTQCHPLPPYLFTAGSRARCTRTALGRDLSRERSTRDSTCHVTGAAAFPRAPGEIASTVQACSNNNVPPCSSLLGGGETKRKIDGLIPKPSSYATKPK